MIVPLITNPTCINHCISSVFFYHWSCCFNLVSSSSVFSSYQLYQTCFCTKLPRTYLLPTSCIDLIRSRSVPSQAALYQLCTSCLVSSSSVFPSYQLYRPYTKPPRIKFLVPHYAIQAPPRST